MEWNRRTVGLVAALMAGVIGACASTAVSTPTPPPTVAPSATGPASPASWTMITISDSVLGQGRGLDDVAAAQTYADFMASDLDVDLGVHAYYYGGSTSSYILDQIRTTPSLRTAISSADVVVFIVPIGELKEDCPWDAGKYQPAPGTPDEYAACGATMVANYAADASAIMDEITSLRTPSKGMIRGVNLWDFFYPQLGALGVGDVTHQIFTNINDAFMTAATGHGIPVADARTGFMGAYATGDPVAGGFVQADGVHPTQQGTDTMGELLRDLGYANTP
jgi:hypothetical protein